MALKPGGIQTGDYSPYVPKKKTSGSKVIDLDVQGGGTSSPSGGTGIFSAAYKAQQAKQGAANQARQRQWNADYRARAEAARARQAAGAARQRAKDAAGGGMMSLGGGGSTTTTYKTPPEPRTSEATKQAVAESLSGMVESYNQAYGQARQANEQRYQQLLQIADKDYQREALIRQRMSMVADRTTGQRAADIRSGAQEEESDVMQRLRQLGMSGTTVAPTLKGGIKTRMEESLNRLADTMQQTKLGVMREQAGQTHGTRLGIMERREDPYPDRGELTGLVKSIGTGQGGDLIPSILGGLSGTGRPAGGAPAGANTSLSAAQYRSKYGA